MAETQMLADRIRGLCAQGRDEQPDPKWWTAREREVSGARRLGWNEALEAAAKLVEEEAAKLAVADASETPKAMGDSFKDFLKRVGDYYDTHDSITGERIQPAPGSVEGLISLGWRAYWTERNSSRSTEPEIMAIDAAIRAVIAAIGGTEVALPPFEAAKDADGGCGQYVSAPASDGQVQITAPRALSAEDVRGIHWALDHLLIVQGHRRPWESEGSEEAGAESDSARRGVGGCE